LPNEHVLRDELLGRRRLQLSVTRRSSTPLAVDIDPPRRKDYAPLGQSMERLKERDLRAIITFLRDAYAEPDLDAFARRVVWRLTDVVGAHRVSYNEAHSRRGTLRLLVRPSDDVPALTARQYRDHPMMQHFIKTGDGR